MNEFLAAFSLSHTSNLSVWLTLSLLHFLWQGLVWAAISAVLGSLLLRSSAHSRYVAHLTVLAGMTLGFGLTLWACRPHRFLMTTLPTQVATTPIDGQQQSASPDSLDGDSRAPSVRPAPVNQTALSSSQFSWKVGLNATISRIAPYAALIYLAGTGVMFLRLAIGVFGGHWVSRESARVTDASLLRLLEEQAVRMRLRVTPVLLLCQRASVPVVLGILRPTILLPVSMSTGLSADQISAILAHELAHIRRGDLIINLFQRVVEAVLFFHPAVWYVSRRIRIERENCCDDCVIAAGWLRMTYIDALLQMAELSVRERGLGLSLATVAATGNDSSEFKLRIMRLLSVPADTAISMSRTSLVVLAAAGLIGLSTFLFAQQVKPNKPASPASVRESTAKPLAPLKAVVVKPDGTPVPNMDVVGYYNHGELIKTLKTDALGQVQVPGEWAIVNPDQGKSVTLLAGDGRQELGWYSFQLHKYLAERQAKEPGNEPAAKNDVLRLVLTKLDRTIRGRLVDAQQKGLGNVRVAVTGWGSSASAGVTSYGQFRGPGLPLPETVTDAQGRFELRVPSGVSVSGFTTSSEYCSFPMHWKEQQDELPDHVLQPGGRVSGIVKNVASGNVVPGATVYLRGISLAGKYGSFAFLKAGANGEFQTPALLPDQYKITAFNPEDEPTLVLAQPARVNVTVAKETTAEVLLAEGTLIQGRCLDARSGQPLANEAIQMQVRMNRNPQSEVDYGHSTHTDAAGHFRFISPAGICTIYNTDGKRKSHPGDRRIVQLEQGKPLADVVLRLGPVITRGEEGEAREAIVEVEDKPQPSSVPRAAPLHQSVPS